MTLTIQDLGALGELLGSVAVLATLVYLALQTRQNTMAIGAQLDAARLNANLLCSSTIVVAGALALPGEALAGWGDENWGAMLWVGATPIPTLGLLGLGLLMVGLASTAAWTLRKRRPRLGLTLMLVLLAIPVVVVARTISIPNTFVNGTVADADQMNANFTEVQTGVNDNAALAATAQGTADTALTNAAAAQGTADTALTNAAAAQGTADTALTNAAAAQGTADTALTNAAAAQSTASTALTNAATAQSTADAAQITASAAQVRVTGNCPAGQSIRAIAADGSVTCEVDETGCADETAEQQFPGRANSSSHREMVGCSGSIGFSARASLCAPGWHVCSYNEWRNNYGSSEPTEDYWVLERLEYAGSGTNNCSVSTDTTGFSCGGSSMKVCAPGGDCNWKMCSYGTSPIGKHDYFGGCDGDSLSGTLCCQGGDLAYESYFNDTSSNNIIDTWLDQYFSAWSGDSSWYLFVEGQVNAGSIKQICLSDAEWYRTTYLAYTPGGASLPKAGNKWYRTLPSLWVSDAGSYSNHYGTACSAGSYSWCAAFGMGAINLAAIPNDVNWGEVYQSVPATIGPAFYRIRSAPTRLSACGF